MSIDLSDYVDAVKADVSAPGEDLLPNATPDQWLQQLSNAFWEARLNGHFVGYVESEGIISPVPTGGDDLPREQVQLIILYAEYKAVRNKLLNMKTRFRGKSGPIEIETERSANLLTALLKDLSARMKELKDNLIYVSGNPTFVFDAVIQHDTNLYYGDSWWTN